MSTYSQDKMSRLNILGSGSVYEAVEEPEDMVAISSKCFTTLRWVTS